MSAWRAAGLPAEHHRPLLVHATASTRTAASPGPAPDGAPPSPPPVPNNTVLIGGSFGAAVSFHGMCDQRRHRPRFPVDDGQKHLGDRWRNGRQRARHPCAATASRPGRQLGAKSSKAKVGADPPAGGCGPGRLLRHRPADGTTSWSDPAQTRPPGHGIAVGQWSTHRSAGQVRPVPDVNQAAARPGQEVKRAGWACALSIVQRTRL